jgi:hypothetical protein
MKFVIDGLCIEIDEADRAVMVGRSWRVCKRGVKQYLAWSTTERGTKKTIYMHRLFAGAKPGQVVDHVNGNGLDNRRENLRIVTITENNRNMPAKSGYSSRFKGVGWNKCGWRVRIRVDYRHITVGFFEDEIEAAFAYDIASLRYHGEYGKRNFLPLA